MVEINRISQSCIDKMEFNYQMSHEQLEAAIEKTNYYVRTTAKSSPCYRMYCAHLRALLDIQRSRAAKAEVKTIDA